MVDQVGPQSDPDLKESEGRQIGKRAAQLVLRLGAVALGVAWDLILIFVYYTQELNRDLTIQFQLRPKKGGAEAAPRPLQAEEAEVEVSATTVGSRVKLEHCCDRPQPKTM